MTYVKQRLGNLCNVRIGRTPRRDSPQYWGGSATWVTVRELNGGVISGSKEQISDLAVREVMQSPIPAGTLLFSFKLSIGKMAIAGVPLYTNEAIAALVIRDASVLDRDYLRFALMTANVGEEANHAVLGKVLNKEKVEGIEIPVPLLPEQYRIVDILSRAEGIVRLRCDAEKKAAELIPALFLELFGDPAANPKGWPTELFGLVGTLDRGKSRNRPRDAKELYGGAYPFIQTGDVANSGGQITHHTATYSELGLAQSRLWPKGTLCITIAANIAKTGVLGFDACFPDSVVGFLPGERTKTEYVQAWLAFLQPMLEANAPQAAQKNINLEILRNLPLPMPPLVEQCLFAKRGDQIRSIQSQHSAATTKAQAAFDALLARCFEQPTTA